MTEREEHRLASISLNGFDVDSAAGTELVGWLRRVVSKTAAASN